MSYYIIKISLNILEYKFPNLIKFRFNIHMLQIRISYLYFSFIIFTVNYKFLFSFTGRVNSKVAPFPSGLLYPLIEPP